MSSKLKVTTSQLVNLLAFADKLKKLQQTRDKTAKIKPANFTCTFTYGDNSRYRENDPSLKLTRDDFLAILDAQIARLVEKFNGDQGDLEVVPEASDLEFPSLGKDED